jgi:DNA replication protein DnaC
MDNQTIQQLLELSLKGMYKAYLEQQEDPVFLEQSFEQRLAHLVDAEYYRRLNNRVNRHLKEAKFKERAFLHEIIYNPERNLNKDLIERLSHNTWIKNHENIIITGATGTGKSYLAQALGDHAIRHGYRARYYRLPELLAELKFGKEVETYLTIRRQLQRIDILILDDWGLAQLDIIQGHEIAEIIEDRLKTKSTIVVSQFPVRTWDQIFKDKTTADAVMDRLVHFAYPIELKGPSLRKTAVSEELKEYKNHSENLC